MKIISDFRKYRWLKRSLLATALFSAGIATAQAAVLTSVRPLGFIAAAIADGITETEILLPDGASPHDYALKPSDIRRIRDADLVVWVGPEMEAFLSKTTEALPKDKNLMLTGLPAVQSLLIADEDDHDHGNIHPEGDEHSADSYKSEKMHGELAQNADDQHNHDHHHGQYNLHVWLSPAIAKQAAIAIHDKLLQQSPQNREKLNVNLRKFEEQLEQTQKKVGMMLQPVHGKGYFVFHDAYAYFENTFGLTPLGHFTVNPEIQPGAQRLHQIRTQLVEQKAVCVFAEPQFRPAVINAVAQGTNVRQGTLDPLGSGIALDKDSYTAFLTRLSEQYLSCLKGD
ncbi:zinc ABC transporter substrate-binding protein ZnuA [Enterobacillus tribolii]|uniref:High-affinity zinc uptake system protein ZnuA n=1 Tax=Enterobacillus tribolii TaxID=1487935 RepID=A0A370R4N5_9GAMM|nr:zinc ABC transporter substrate-binding protein ZnuA [Enterobacillus tribolii]MBW7983308.1 zinc ABC transporter substrate-binding protein ZnuA [Enterobacillus tribolii]RDK97366.1 zinc transport system substrate-binding protein [Enterobacillus tribolii]